MKTNKPAWNGNNRAKVNKLYLKRKNGLIRRQFPQMGSDKRITSQPLLTHMNLFYWNLRCHSNSPLPSPSNWAIGSTRCLSCRKDTGARVWKIDHTHQSLQEKWSITNEIESWWLANDRMSECQRAITRCPNGYEMMMNNTKWYNELKNGVERLTLNH